MIARRHRLPGRVARLAAAAAAIVFGSITGPALAHGPDPILGGANWAQDQAVTYTWKADQVPPAWLQAVVDAGAAASNSSRASRAAVFSRAAGALSLVSYGEPTGCGSNGLACASRAGVPKSFRIWFRTQGWVFDWGVLRYCQAPGNDTNGCVDALSAAVHELGHVQNLGHHADFANNSDWWDTIMHTIGRLKPRDGYNIHEFRRCDTARLQLEYDRQSWQAPVSTCLSIPTVTTLSAYPTAAVVGESVRFSASLRTGTGAAYRALSNDPLSGRSVVLQRRLPGATAWTTALTMAATATAGVYSVIWSPTATFEWQAVFVTSAGEGLSGSASPVVTVTVSGCTLGCPQSASD